MPAEWEPHEATWIAGPNQRLDWPGKFACIPWVYTEIVRHLHYSERVRILVKDARMQRRVCRMLARAALDLSRVEFYTFPTNRVWIRDYGPLSIKQETGAVAVTDWRFNAWAKYPDWQLDDAVPRHIRDALGLPAWQAVTDSRKVVLEGGSIDVNGQGLLLTTEECLVGEFQQRNPCLSPQDLEKVLADYLDVKKVLWLNRGIAPDDTHGHIDDLARFVGPHTSLT